MLEWHDFRALNRCFYMNSKFVYCISSLNNVTFQKVSVFLLFTVSQCIEKIYWSSVFVRSKSLTDLSYQSHGQKKLHLRDPVSRSQSSISYERVPVDMIYFLILIMIQYTSVQTLRFLEKLNSCDLAEANFMIDVSVDHWTNSPELAGSKFRKSWGDAKDFREKIL